MVTTTDIKHTLNQYFPDSAYAIEFKSVFRCAYFCTITTTAGNVFTFFKQVCKCFYEYELKSTLVKMPVCFYWDPAQMESVDKVYSISRSSLPIFKFETGFHGSGTWTTAIYNCAVNGSLLKKKSDNSDHWLSYFKYEDGHISTPVLRNQGSELSASPTESNFEGTTWPPHTNMSNVEKPVGKIVVVNVVLFGLCSLFVILIIFRKRLALQVCQRGNQKLKTNKINTKPVVQRDGNSEKNKGKFQNENNTDRDNYVEPWEMRQNIVHMDELCQQDIIDVQTEETET
ncbi:Hypothetical predicted protein [Mytilus galloprovincialis]|uniref:Uncharacterized protein n=1 Tax=Mytilus galloprovincialis TaxID=29158 RepID=A0A8B6GU65_MYTGA|nr:Hypothetical predicted protein [Mytilus galloprovincialis]